tara:strand:+ start:77 stop:331 length:255 start_codon:yes stop_codon:yes gene_type:complete
VRGIIVCAFFPKIVVTKGASLVHRSREREREREAHERRRAKFAQLSPPRVARGSSVVGEKWRKKQRYVFEIATIIEVVIIPLER